MGRGGSSVMIGEITVGKGGISVGRGGTNVGRGGTRVGRGGCVAGGCVAVGSGGLGVLVAFGVLVALGVRVGGGVAVAGGVTGSILWQRGSARSVCPSPSSSTPLKQFSPGTVFNTCAGISQTVMELKLISPVVISIESTNNPASPLA